MVALRKIHNRIAEGDVAQMRVSLPRDVAIYLLNQKREDLALLERRYAATITILLSDKLMSHQSEIETRTRDASERPAPAIRPGEVVALDAGLPTNGAPRTAAAASTSRSAAMRAAAAAPAADAPARRSHAARASGEGESRAEGEGRGRRRRRRGGRGRRAGDEQSTELTGEGASGSTPPAEGTLESAPPPDEPPVETPPVPEAGGDPWSTWLPAPLLPGTDVAASSGNGAAYEAAAEADTQVEDAPVEADSAPDQADDAPLEGAPGEDAAPAARRRRRRGGKRGGRGRRGVRRADAASGGLPAGEAAPVGEQYSGSVREVGPGEASGSVEHSEGDASGRQRPDPHYGEPSEPPPAVARIEPPTES